MDITKLLLNLAIIPATGGAAIPIGQLAGGMLEAVIGLTHRRPERPDGTQLTAEEVQASVASAFDTFERIKDTAKAELEK